MLEARSAGAKAKTPQKSPSAELRAAEAKRENAARKKKQAEDELEAIAIAKQDLEVREARGIAAQAAQQSALDEADIELERSRRTVACPGPCVFLSENQAKAVPKQVWMAHTIVADARAALDKPAFKAPQTAERAIFDSLSLESWWAWAQSYHRRSSNSPSQQRRRKTKRIRNGGWLVRTGRRSARRRGVG